MTDSLATRQMLDRISHRADQRRVGELVRYPSLNGDRLITRTGTIDTIRCTNPAEPYDNRTLEFAIIPDDAPFTDRVRVAVNFRGIEPIEPDGG